MGEAIPLLHIDHEVERSQIAHCKAHKAARSADATARALKEIHAACINGSNLVEAILAGVKVGVTLGEVSDVFPRGIWRLSRPGVPVVRGQHQRRDSPDLWSALGFGSWPAGPLRRSVEIADHLRRCGKLRPKVLPTCSPPS